MVDNRPAALHTAECFPKPLAYRRAAPRRKATRRQIHHRRNTIRHVELAFDHAAQGSAVLALANGALEFGNALDGLFDLLGAVYKIEVKDMALGGRGNRGRANVEP